LYLCCAFGAVAAHLLVSQSPVVGASGAIYGVVIAFATLFPDMRLQLIFPPIPVKAKYLALFYIVGDLYHGLSGSQDNVAHFAHLGGALIGFLMVKFYFTSPNRR
jgi:membrane associated rhomboid family serine protease